MSKELNTTDTTTYLTETGLNLPKTCTEEQYMQVGQVLGRIERGMQWAIGDWYNGFKWGDKKEACEKAGLNYKTARNCAVVAARFQMSRRRDICSYSHYELLAAESLNEDQRKDLLNIASKEGLSVKRLREEKDKLLGKRTKTATVAVLPEPKVEPTPVIPQPAAQTEYPTYPCEVNFEDLSIDSVIETLKFLTHYLKNVKVMPAIWTDSTPLQESLIKQEVQIMQRAAFDASEDVTNYYLNRFLGKL